MANVDFEASCDLVGNIIYCSINTDIENSEYAFYIILDGERKATFWYTTRPKIEYNCGNEIFSTYEIVFFVRSNNNDIITKSITKRSNWSICNGILQAVKNLVNENSIIVEFGSGIGSKLLSEFCTVYSIEHDEKFLNLHEDVNYIYAPLVEIKPLLDFNETQWYDIDIIKRNLPSNIDLVLVDGPPEKYGRSGILNHLDMFGKNTIWIVDDVLRQKDQTLANYIALKFGFIQYRFWNFSIITNPNYQIKNLDKINEAALNEYEEKSEVYISNFYPSI